MADLVNTRLNGGRYVFFNQNRHINPTNVCAFHCNFCSFRRDEGEAGEGEVGPGGGPAGDLYVRLDVEPHPLFRREEQHLRVTVPITFAEAALGAQVKVPVPGGSTVTVKIPAGTAKRAISRTSSPERQGPAVAGRTPAGSSSAVTTGVPPPTSVRMSKTRKAQSTTYASGEAEVRLM